MFPTNTVHVFPCGSLARLQCLTQCYIQQMFRVLLNKNSAIDCVPSKFIAVTSQLTVVILGGGALAGNLVMRVEPHKLD